MTPEWGDDLPDALLEELSDSPTVQSLTALIGEELMTRLSIELGGRQISFSANPGPHSPLAAVIGMDAARRIGKIYAGDKIDIPVQAGKRARIMELHKAKMSVNHIAHTMRLSRRTIQRTLKAMLANDDQMELF